MDFTHYDIVERDLGRYLSALDKEERRAEAIEDRRLAGLSDSPCDDCWAQYTAQCNRKCGNFDWRT